MRQRVFFLFFLCIQSYVAQGQQGYVSGQIIDSVTKAPLPGITIMLQPGNKIDITDEVGRFKYSHIHRTDLIVISGVGYERKVFHLDTFKNSQQIMIHKQQTMLSDIVITASNKNPYKAISESDIKFRGVSNSQEVLRMVPGLFISQHQGGGKAEQIFLRGVDNDHGTDISLNMDGMPINMVSHAHGQGYADSHFIIPETIESIAYEKGPYDITKGDLAVSGAVDFKTANAINTGIVKLEAGQFDTYRTLIILNLLGAKAKVRNQSWYAASEYRYSNSYFDNPQHFKRFNFFTKYHGELDEHNWLTVTASSLYSTWNASGQIPEDAVIGGSLSYFGAVDPNEGGVTSRSNLIMQLMTSLRNNDVIKNQLYYTRYKFDLHSNFTFFLADSVNGDEIRQRESRNLYGYNGSYTHEGFLGKMKLTTDAGLSARLDATDNSELSHTVDRYTLLKRFKLGDITELNTGAYINEILWINPSFHISAGLNFYRFFYQYNNKLPEDTILNGTGFYKAYNHVLSPKLNLYYQVNRKIQYYLFLGKGFNSNDARAVVATNGLSALPAAYSADIGTTFKPTSSLLLNVAIWYSYLQKEYVYGGDGGTVDFSGRTSRRGVDISMRYQPDKALYFDVDMNYAHGRALDDPQGRNYIPLAPVWSSTGGLSYISKNGLNGSLRYRYLSDRPANEDNSKIAQGYLVNDLVLNYTKARYEIGITISNLFNVQWKESQFVDDYRLKNQSPAEGLTFTPGTKFTALIHLSYFIK